MTVFQPQQQQQQQQQPSLDLQLPMIPFDNNFNLENYMKIDAYGRRVFPRFPALCREQIAPYLQQFINKEISRTLGNLQLNKETFKDIFLMVINGVISDVDALITCVKLKYNFILSAQQATAAAAVAQIPQVQAPLVQSQPQPQVTPPPQVQTPPPQVVQPPPVDQAQTKITTVATRPSTPPPTLPPPEAPRVDSDMPPEHLVERIRGQFALTPNSPPHLRKTISNFEELFMARVNDKQLIQLFISGLRFPNQIEQISRHYPGGHRPSTWAKFKECIFLAYDRNPDTYPAQFLLKLTKANVNGPGTRYNHEFMEALKLNELRPSPFVIRLMWRFFQRL
ncbi:hypothetical protein SAMD00019534_040950 [Acytostelium subglobosum LB1]|uniref:hypothetical protein n=1 Tax=Acytostelium subglobosum LB1 TaxID=1410327 RepID=UPI0006449855|nr:hypothetical protein SAMD00019534_040950 [Acytostelium subglobosum LB1]GAM20920.1 hypothetical protein SAMD00019534_040950 [Acytostelium subglobosum LB1]|eukprot:XP_012756054.1 hypothetical protein SAMD00019534_040950 [Acytostelium subglobosum LB1]